jgi:hypothetical protein
VAVGEMVALVVFVVIVAVLEPEPRADVGRVVAREAVPLAVLVVALVAVGALVGGRVAVVDGFMSKGC